MNMIDIYGFAEATDNVVPAEAQALKEAINEAVWLNKAGKARKGSHGISMYYPLMGDR